MILKMKRGLYCLIALALWSSCKSPKTSIQDRELGETSPQVNYAFPMDWIGTYKGQLVILTSPKDSTIVDMGLSIGAPDQTGLYPWIITYGSEDKRYYGLEAIDAVRGHYRIDELNSIKIDGYLRGNHFITRFEVMGSDLLVDYEKQAEGIRIRFYVTGAASLNETGGEVLGQDTVPTVKSYPIMVIQEAWLSEIG